MFFRHRGLLIFVLFAVVGHAALFEALLPTLPRGSPLGFSLLFAPVALILLGNWICDESARLRRLGFALSGVGALWHLALDLLCLGLPLWGAAEWRIGVAGALVGGVVMLVALVHSWRGFRDPDAPPPSLAPVPGESLPRRIAREAALVGGTPIAVAAVSLGIVGLALVGMVRHPQADLKIVGAAGFFVACAVIALYMGLDRRAMILGIPSPLARFRVRRAAFLATKEGLALRDRKGATLYPWHTLARLRLGELYGNPALFVELQPDAPATRHEKDGSHLALDEKWARSERRNRSIQRALTGADLAIMGVLTEAGPGPLAKQIESALQSAAAADALPTLAEEMARRYR